MIWGYPHFRKPPFYMFYLLSHTLTLLFFEHEQITATRQSKFTLHANPPVEKWRLHRCSSRSATSPHIPTAAVARDECDEEYFFQSVWILTSAGWISLLLLQIIFLFLKSHQKDRKGAPFPNIPLVRSQLCSFNSKLLPLQTVAVSGERKTHLYW